MSVTLKSLYRRLVKPKKPEPGAMGLPEATLEGLEVLIQQPLWRHWQVVLESVLEQRLGRMATGLPHDEYLKTSGEVRLLIQLATLPETLLATERVRHARQWTEPSGDTGAFVNSPWNVAGTR